MNNVFENQFVNERATSLMSEINQILDLLENIDNLMPSASLEQKLSVDPTTRKKFKEISENSIQFLDDRINYFKDEMSFFKEQIGEFDNNYRSMADAIVILACKILGFQIGKVSWFVYQKDNFIKKEMHESNSELLYNIKRLLYTLSEFDTTYIGSDELIKTDRTVIKINKKLNPKPLFIRFLRIFR